MLCENHLAYRKLFFYSTFLTAGFFVSYAFDHWFLRESGWPFAEDTTLTTYAVLLFLAGVMAKLFSDTKNESLSYQILN